MVFGTIKVRTPLCRVCGQAGSAEVLKADYEAWQSGTLIQVAFPELPANLREQLKTGIHPECWDLLDLG